VLSDEEPRYLRRQKPLEIKRRKFGRKAWMTYLRVAAWIALGLAAAWVAYASGHFLYASRQMALVHPEQVELTGTQYVARARVLEIFSADRNRSVLRIPLDERRRQLETIPWVEHATVRRALPNRVEIEIVERTPIAYLRQGSDLSLVDSHGVILERPTKGAFHFPVVTGISSEMAQEDRERRMQLYAGFARQIEAARSGALEKVSDVDLADGNDLKANLTGLAGGPAGKGAASNRVADNLGGAWGQADAPLLVHFGDGDFETKYRNLVENIGQWRATAGRVDSIDMRFSREAVVNPDTTPVARPAPKTAPASAAPKAAPAHSPEKAAAALPAQKAPAAHSAAPKSIATPKSSPAKKSNAVQKAAAPHKTGIARHSTSGQKANTGQKSGTDQKSSRTKKSSTATKAASKPAHPAAKPAA
jgi:cell division protein FtsQ